MLKDYKDCRFWACEDFQYIELDNANDYKRVFIIK